jgi:hypothetical protein
MDVTMRRGKKNGYEFFVVSIDDQKMNLYEASRILTGTTNESGGDGVFRSIYADPKQRFSLGDERHEFNWPVFVFEWHTLAECKDEVYRRVDEVRKWVQSVDFEEVIVFGVSDIHPSTATDEKRA